ncbi:hypothetical protein GTU79_07370 [Sodalis ligni]|nr:hypothetical protein GTU79_07370 [Sodalis ligni]
MKYSYARIFYRTFLTKDPHSIADKQQWQQHPPQPRGVFLPQ